MANEGMPSSSEALGSAGAPALGPVAGLENSSDPPRAEDPTSSTRTRAPGETDGDVQSSGDGRKTDYDRASGVAAGDYTRPMIESAHEHAASLPPTEPVLEPTSLPQPSQPSQPRKRKRSDEFITARMSLARKRLAGANDSGPQLAQRQSPPGEESRSTSYKGEKYIGGCMECPRPAMGSLRICCIHKFKMKQHDMTQLLAMCDPGPTYAVRRLIYLGEQDVADPASVARYLRMIATDQVARAFFLSRTGADAERLVPLLQEWVSKCSFHESDLFRRKIVALLVKLSVASGVLPEELFIQGVSIGEDRDPWTSGGFADVFRGVYNHQPVAVKRLRVLNEDKAIVNPMICREALLWRQLDHPHILPFLGVDAETFSSRNALCLISPWMQGGTLKQYITSTLFDPAADRNRLLREIAQGIQYLHEENVVHGDINWNNIFVDDCASAKIADFGLAIISEVTGGGTTTTHTGPKGTVAWMSPERINGPSRLKPPMDVYSFGILCLTMWTRKRPFPTLNDIAILLRVVQGQRPKRPGTWDSPGEALPEDVWSFIEKCWAQDPLARPLMDEVIQSHVLKLEVKHSFEIGKLSWERGAPAVMYSHAAMYNHLM